jgi:hypothetical protein
LRIDESSSIIRTFRGGNMALKTAAPQDHLRPID